MSGNSEVEGKGQIREGMSKEYLVHSTAIFLWELTYKSTQKISKIMPITAENSSLTVTTIYMQDRGKYYQK